MALSKSSLKARIISELSAQGFNTTNTYSYAQKMATALASAVIDEIQNNAVVTTTVTGVKSGGSTASGTGTVS